MCLNLVEKYNVLHLRNCSYFFFFFGVIVPKFLPIKNSAKHGSAKWWGEVFEPCDLIKNLRRQIATISFNRNSDCVGGSLGWHGCRLP